MNVGHFVADNLLFETSVTIERKEFHIEKRVNSRGRYYRITETNASHRFIDRIVVPESGLDRFMEGLKEAQRAQQGRDDSLQNL